MTPAAKEFIDWLHLQQDATYEASRNWDNRGSNEEYSNAGASNAFLEVIDYVERHPYVLAEKHE